MVIYIYILKYIEIMNRRRERYKHMAQTCLKACALAIAMHPFFPQLRWQCSCCSNAYELCGAPVCSGN